MKRFFMVIASIVFGLTLLFASTSTFAASDAAKEQACKAIGGTYSGGTCSDGSAKAQPQDLISEIITIFSWVVGAISVIMLIFGGFKYVTSGGDSGKITSAKNTIVYALVGLVIVALSQVIVNFVLYKTNCTVNPGASSCKK
jgi:hypothetical protein